MAISRHSSEWQRVIATAALAGITFHERAVTRRYTHLRSWVAFLPAEHGWVEGPSKFATAKRALEELDIANVAAHE